MSSYKFSDLELFPMHMEEKIFAGHDESDLISASGYLHHQSPVQIEPSLELIQKSEVAFKRQPFTIDYLAKSSATHPMIPCRDPPVSQSPPSPSDSCIHYADYGVLPELQSPPRLRYSTVNCDVMSLCQSAATSDFSMSPPCALPVTTLPPSSPALMPQPAGSPTVPSSHAVDQGIGTGLSHAGSRNEMFLSPAERGAAMPKMRTSSTNVNVSACCSGREGDEASHDSAFELLCDAARSKGRQPSVRPPVRPPTCLTLDQGRAVPCEPPQAVTSKSVETESKSRTPIQCEQTLIPGTPPLQLTLEQHLPQVTLNSQVNLLSRSTPVPLVDSQWLDSPASLHTPDFTAEPTFFCSSMSPILTPYITDFSPVTPQLNISISSSSSSSFSSSSSSPAAASPSLTSSTPDPLSSESNPSLLDSSSQTTGNMSCENHVTSILDVPASDEQKKENEKSFLTTSTNSDERAKRTRSSNRRKLTAKRKNPQPQSPRQSRTDNELGSVCDEGTDDASGESKRKHRTKFTKAQLSALEREYSANKYLPPYKRAGFAKTVGLLQIQVKTWFQNRRMKDKRENKAEGMPSGGINIRDLTNMVVHKYSADRAEPHVQPAGHPDIGARPTMPTNVCRLAAWPSTSTALPFTYMTSSVSSLPLFQVLQHPLGSFAAPSSLPLPVDRLTRTQDGVARTKQARGEASPVSEEMTGDNSSDIDGCSADGDITSQSRRPCTEAFSTVQPYAGLSTGSQPPNVPSIFSLHHQPIFHFPDAPSLISPSLTLSSGASTFFYLPPLTSHSCMQQSYQTSAALHNAQASSTLSGATPARSSVTSALTPDSPLKAMKYQGDMNPASNCSPLLYPAAYYPQSFR